MTNKTEDKFYFGKSEQKTKFGSDTRAVNRQARMWLSQANNAGADEGLEQFHARLIKRLAEIIKSTDELIRNPKKEEDYGGWSYDDLEKELLSVAPHSNVARRWLQSNLRGGRFSRPGQPERFMRDIPVKSWKKGAEDYEAGITEDLGQFQPYVNMPKSGILVTRNAPTFKSEAGARKWLSEYLTKHGFSRPGQPERFADGTESFLTIKGVRYRIVGTRKDARGNLVYDLHGTSKTAHPVPFTLVKFRDDGRWVLWGAHGGEVARGKIEASRPGQPERFGLEDACWEGYEPVGTKQKDGRTVPNCVPKDENAEPEEFAAEIVSSRGSKRAEIKRDATGRWAAVLIQSNRTGVPGESSDEQVLDMKWFANESNARKAAQKMLASRPGQPDKFDASSLNRGDFAEASTSPMLGKLLAAKVMPEGGWRAVQVGSDTLVISFEDADLASDFGRRVATKGYNATSPVQAIGRYWNVEVKNGK